MNIYFVIGSTELTPGAEALLRSCVALWKPGLYEVRYAPRDDEPDGIERERASVIREFLRREGLAVETYCLPGGMAYLDKHCCVFIDAAGHDAVTERNRRIWEITVDLATN